MKRLILLVFIVMSVVALQRDPRAADAEGNYVITGEGSVKCKIWLTERENETWESLAYTSWINGYVSAKNEYTKGAANIIEGVDINVFMTLIDDHCAHNPDDDLHRATETLIKYFLSKKK